jgi:hypothetical protein
MKVILLISSLFMSLSAMAYVNCDIYLVMSELDGRKDLTEQVVRKFEEQGYRISRVEKVSDIRDQGKVSYMTIFSDIHSTIGAKTTIRLTDLHIEGRFSIIQSESQINLSAKPLFGSATKALLKSVEKSIPACVK